MTVLVTDLAEETGVSGACRTLGVPRSWYYRQRSETNVAAEPGADAVRPTPAHALSQEEKDAVRAVLNSERFCDQAPREVYATLLDEGQYLCHWRTMYRVLAEYGEVRERRNQREHPVYARPQLVARRPNAVWSWDITWLAGPQRGLFYYLYVILDLFSRFVVGWMVAEEEAGAHAERLIATTCTRQGVAAEQLTLHADRGSPMRAGPVVDLLALLGVTRSHSRPRTSNDNPYSEAQFKTLKYRPDYPDRFQSLAHARRWARQFFHWYNHEHHHVNLGLLTPAMVHFGQVDTVCRQRQQVLDEAFARHPARFARGRPVAARPPSAVWINPPLASEKDAAVVNGNGTAFSGAASAHTQPAAQAGSTVGAIALEPDKQPANMGLTLCPEPEVKTTVVLDRELSQSP